jgi:hypothetical protein
MNRWKIRLAAIAALLTLGLSVAAAEAKKSRGVAVIANADGTIQVTTTPVTIIHGTGGAYTINFPARTWTPGALPVPIFNTTNGATISELHIGFAAADGSETIHVTFTLPAQFNFLAFEFLSED